jgi:hypothetical protein
MQPRLAGWRRQSEKNQQHQHEKMAVGLLGLHESCFVLLDLHLIVDKGMCQNNMQLDNMTVLLECLTFLVVQHTL